MELLYSANAIPITPSNLLRLAFWNARNDTGYTVLIRYQVENKDGSVSNNIETCVVNASANNQQFAIRLPYGNLLAVTASTFGTTLQNGGLYCSIRLQYGEVNDSTQQLPLIAGYVLSGAPLSYPLNQPAAVNSGVPTTRVVQVGDPTAGNEITSTEAATSQSKLLNGRFTLTTDATVATRTVTFIVSDQTGQVYLNNASATQTAGLSVQYQLWPTPIPASIGPAVLFIGIQPTPYLQTIKIDTLTTNIQGDDQFSNIIFWLEQLATI